MSASSNLNVSRYIYDILQITQKSVIIEYFFLARYQVELLKEKPNLRKKERRKNKITTKVQTCLARWQKVFKVIVDFIRRQKKKVSILCYIESCIIPCPLSSLVFSCLLFVSCEFWLVLIRFVALLYLCQLWFVCMSLFMHDVYVVYTCMHYYVYVYLLQKKKSIRILKPLLVDYFDRQSETAVSVTDSTKVFVLTHLSCICFYIKLRSPTNQPFLLCCVIKTTT